MRREGILMALVCVAAATAPSLAAETPEAVEESRALGFVEAVSAGDATALVAYIRDNFAPDTWERREPADWEDLARRLVGRHAGLRTLGVDTTRPHALSVEAEDPRGILRLEFEFEAQAPHRISGLGLQMGGGPGPGLDLPPFEVAAGASREQIAAAVEAYFRDLAAREVFSGAALVAWRGEIVAKGAWGLASLEFEVPNKTETRFDLGSINKSFTRVAVGQLLAAGKLALDDTIADHLPDYPNPDAARKITVRHLLDHTSGLGDIFNERFFRSSRALYRRPSDFFPLFADEPLLFEPGSRSEYSNAGYMVLGAILEAASGESYSEYVERHVFAPAGMKRSGFFARDEPVPDVAVGYTRGGPGEDKGDLRKNLFMLPIRGNPAGSAQSTVEDLLAFDLALRHHRLLPPAYTRWYFGGPEPTGEEASADAAPARDGVGIAGGGPGVSAVLESDGDLVVIVLSNFDPPIASAAARRLSRPLGEALRR